ncbi:MAG: hypothetical protein GY838_16070 [bacterium]|nr:hypothetical protein [bacterium]
MPQDTCTSCFGTGSYQTTERVNNPAGGMYQEVPVSKPCMACSGAGTIWKADQPKPRRAQRAQEKERAHQRVDSGEASAITEPTDYTVYSAGEGESGTKFEEFVAGLIFIVVGLSTGYYCSTETTMNWPWAVGLGFGAGFVSFKLFTGPLRWILTTIKWILATALMIAVGSAFVLLIIEIVKANSS